MGSKIKLCMDCKHYYLPYPDIMLGDKQACAALCFKGTLFGSSRSPEDARKSDGLCGPDGKLWEAKSSESS